MGLREFLAVGLSSLFIGILLVSGIFDFPILYGQTRSAEMLAAAERYYITWWYAAPEIKVMLHGLMILMVGVISTNFAKFTESALYFDGGSLLLTIGCFAIYSTVTVPGVKLLGTHPSPSGVLVVPTSSHPIFPQSVYSPTTHLVTISNSIVSYMTTAFENKHGKIPDVSSEEFSDSVREESLGVLSAGNTIAIVLLVGVIFLQVGKYWADEEEAKIRSDMLISDYRDALKAARGGTVPLVVVEEEVKEPEKAKGKKAAKAETKKNK